MADGKTYIIDKLCHKNRKNLVEMKNLFKITFQPKYLWYNRERFEN